jgi:predicted dehydrogenase
VKPPRVGVVGYGRFGRFLHSAWGDAVVAVCDQKKPLRVEHPTHRCLNFDELLDIPNIDVVAIATPPSSHASLAIKALKSGMDVIIEQPIATTLEAADALIEARNTTGRVATVDHVLRFNPLVMAATELARANVMGAFRSLSVVNHADRTQIPPSHWFWNEATSGGILVEHGVHFFDLADEMAGSSGVETCGMHLGDPPDGAMALIRHESGTVSTHLHVFDRTSETESTTIDLDFDAGSLRLIGWMPLNVELWTDPTTQRRVRESLKHTSGELHVQEGSPMRISLPYTKTEVYRSCLRALLSAVGTERINPGSLPVTLEDGRRALATAQAATANRCLEGQE